MSQIWLFSEMLDPYIWAPSWMEDYIRSYRAPFEAVANRRWLFETFGIGGK